jgi:SSS family solute:Na+ symporter
MPMLATRPRSSRGHSPAPRSTNDAARATRRAGGRDLIDANWLDYVLVAAYFAFVLGIGCIARRQVSDSIDFFRSGRSLPAWVTGLAFISANLGAVEIMGMSANGAQFGMPTVHYFWIGAIPAMLFLGVVMMPFSCGSKVRSVPESTFRRFGTGAHLVNAISFALAQLLVADANAQAGVPSAAEQLDSWPGPRSPGSTPVRCQCWASSSASASCSSSSSRA